MFSFFRNKRIAKIEKRLDELEQEVIQLRERTQLAINALQEDYESKIERMLSDKE